MTPNFYDHDGPGGKPTDAKGDEQMMVGMYKAMPDLPLTIEEMIAEGTKSFAATSGVGPTWHPARRCSFTGSSSGVLRRAESPSVGPQ